MMRRWLFGLVALALLTTRCSKFLPACPTGGHPQRRELMVPAFDTLVVGQGVRLVLHQGPYYAVRLEYPPQLAPYLSLQSRGRRLSVDNSLKCPVQSARLTATAHVYAPRLNVLIANTDLDVRSAGSLAFPQWKIYCENATLGTNNTARFDLHLNGGRLFIVANGSSVFRLRGHCRYLNAGFYGFQPTLRARHCPADTVFFLQRSGGEMHLYPLRQVTGKLYGFGNVFLYHRPPDIRIRRYYGGQVIWKD